MAHSGDRPRLTSRILSPISNMSYSGMFALEITYEPASFPRANLIWHVNATAVPSVHSFQGAHEHPVRNRRTGECTETRFGASSEASLLSTEKKSWAHLERLLKDDLVGVRLSRRLSGAGSNAHSVQAALHLSVEARRASLSRAGGEEHGCRSVGLRNDGKACGMCRNAATLPSCFLGAFLEWGRCALRSAGKSAEAGAREKAKVEGFNDLTPRFRPRFGPRQCDGFPTACEPQC